MSNARAAILMVLSMAGFAVEDAIIKYLSAWLPVGQVIMVIGCGGLLVFAMLARRARVRLWDLRAVQGAALGRNLTEMGAASCFVMAIALVPLAVVTAILQAAPLLVTMGAAVFLGEKVGWRRWLAIAVGFVGMLLILRPGSVAFDPAVLLAVVGVILLSARDLLTRRVRADIHSVQLAGWGFFMVIPAGVLLMLVMQQPPVVPTLTQGAWLGFGLVAGVLAYSALVQATRLGDLAATTPFRYSRLVFAMAIGALVFGEHPDALTIAGSILIVAAGLYSLLREHRLRRAA
jgi:drug/metabolite transporter (DMT)-like permease